MHRSQRVLIVRRRVVATVATAALVGGLAACNGEEASVIIRDGANAGKEYTPALAGGLGVQQCLAQNICVKKSQ
jgi:hypothetical protein